MTDSKKTDIRNRFKFDIISYRDYFIVNIDKEKTDANALNNDIYKFIAAVQKGLKIENKPYYILASHIIKLYK